MDELVGLALDLAAEVKRSKEAWAMCMKEEPADQCVQEAALEFANNVARIREIAGKIKNDYLISFNAAEIPFLAQLLGGEWISPPPLTPGQRIDFDRKIRLIVKP